MMNRMQKAQARAALKAVARNSKNRAANRSKTWEQDDQWMLAADIDRVFPTVKA